MLNICRGCHPNDSRAIGREFVRCLAGIQSSPKQAFVSRCRTLVPIWIPSKGPNLEDLPIPTDGDQDQLLDLSFYGKYAQFFNSFIDQGPPEAGDVKCGAVQHVPQSVADMGGILQGVRELRENLHHSSAPTTSSVGGESSDTSTSPPMAARRPVDAALPAAAPPSEHVPAAPRSGTCVSSVASCPSAESPAVLTTTLESCHASGPAPSVERAIESMPHIRRDADQNRQRRTAQEWVRRHIAGFMVADVHMVSFIERDAEGMPRAINEYVLGGDLATSEPEMMDVDTVFAKDEVGHMYAALEELKMEARLGQLEASEGGLEFLRDDGQIVPYLTPK